MAQHQQAIDAVRQTAEFFMLDLSDNDVENILLKTGEATWLESKGGKRK